MNKKVANFHKSVVTMPKVPQLFNGTVIYTFLWFMKTTGTISLKIRNKAAWTIALNVKLKTKHHIEKSEPTPLMVCSHHEYQ